jgi:hypothetical protein
LTVAFVAIAAAACSSSSKSASSATTPTTASYAGTPSTSAGTPTTGPASSAGTSGANFCGLVRDEESALNPARDLETMTPAQLQSLFSKVGPALQHAEPVVPGAIKGDVAVLVTVFGKLDSALASAQYNVADLNPSILEELDTTQARTAFANVLRYVEQVCDVSPPTT